MQNKAASCVPVSRGWAEECSDVPENRGHQSLGKQVACGEEADDQ